MTTAADILDFWFGPLDEHGYTAEDRNPLWWGKDAAIDQQITELFADTRQAAIDGKLKGWLNYAEMRLAAIILIDQFSRQIHRDTPAMFEHDHLALKWCKQGIALGQDKELALVYRVFFYMPLMHSEDRAVQAESMRMYTILHDTAPKHLKEKFAYNLDFARQHQAIIELFGRYPHRNTILGRSSTPKEIKFLQQPGSSF